MKMISYMQNSLEFQGRQRKLAAKALRSGLPSFLWSLLFGFAREVNWTFLLSPLLISAWALHRIFTYLLKI